MSIQRYDVVGYGQQDIVRSETGEFVDFDDHCKEIDRLTRELAEAKARIAELETLVDLYRKQGADQDARAWIAMSAECEARGQEMVRLRAEVEALRADAERWKWRKENPTARLVYSCGCYRVENWTTWYTSADDAVPDHLLLRDAAVAVACNRARWQSERARKAAKRAAQRGEGE